MRTSDTEAELEHHTFACSNVGEMRERLRELARIVDGATSTPDPLPVRYRTKPKTATRALSTSRSSSRPNKP